VSVLTCSVVGCEFEQIKDYKIGIRCFSAKTLSINEYGLAPIQDNVSEWSDMSTRGLLFQ